MKKICVVDTVYSLLLYLLYNPNWDSDTQFFCGETLPEEVRRNLKMRMIKYPKSRIGKILFRFRFGIIIQSLFAKEVYGQDHLPISHLFLRKGFICIEDGLANYWIEGIEEGNKLSFAAKYLYGWKKSKGYSNRVSKIILTGLYDIPAEIRDKVEILDLKAVMAHVNLNKIYNLFGISNDLLGKRSVLLLTQPLNEGKKGITAQKQLEIYKSIVKRYNAKNVVIKPHPRDICDYSSMEVEVLPPFFPVELLLFNQNSIELLVTLWSSSAYHSSNVKRVEILGTSEWPFLEEGFGHIPSRTIINDH